MIKLGGQDSSIWPFSLSVIAEEECTATSSGDTKSLGGASRWNEVWGCLKTGVPIWVPETYAF